MIGEYRVLEKGPGLLAPFPLLYFRVFVWSCWVRFVRSFVFVVLWWSCVQFRQADRRELQCSPLSSFGVLKAMGLCGMGGESFMSVYWYGWLGVIKGAEVEVFEGTKTMSIHVSRIHVLRMVECL